MHSLARLPYEMFLPIPNIPLDASVGVPFRGHAGEDVTGLARANLTRANPDSIEVANPRANTETNPMLLHCQAPDVVGQMLDSKATPKPAHGFPTRAQLRGIAKVQATVSKHADGRVRPQVDCHTNGETAPQPEQVLRLQVKGSWGARKQSLWVLPEHVHGIGSRRPQGRLARVLPLRLLKAQQTSLQLLHDLDRKPMPLVSLAPRGLQPHGATGVAQSSRIPSLGSVDHDWLESTRRMLARDGWNALEPKQLLDV